MKCNQDLFETLFQTAQKPLVMECSQALEAIRFSLPIDWTVQQQSESLLYLLPSEGESSLSVCWAARPYRLPKVRQSPQ